MRSAPWGVALLAVGLLAGCGAHDSGSPGAAGGSGTGTGQGVLGTPPFGAPQRPHPGAPKVARDPGTLEDVHAAFAVLRRPRRRGDVVPAEAVTIAGRQLKPMRLRYGLARRLWSGTLRHASITAWLVPGDASTCILYTFPTRPTAPRAYAVQCEPDGAASLGRLVVTMMPGAPGPSTITIGAAPDRVRRVVASDGRHLRVERNEYAAATDDPAWLKLYRAHARPIVIRVR